MQTPRFENVSCSQCGGSFGPGEHGFSHCDNHQGMSMQTNDSGHVAVNLDKPDTSVDAEAIARKAVEDFKAALWKVPNFGNRVNKETRQKLSEAHSIILNLPCLLDAAVLAKAGANN